MDLLPTLQKAAALQNAGRLTEAEQLCLGMLQAAPHFFQARHLLGMIWLQQDRPAEALTAIEMALKAAPSAPAILAAHGQALRANGRLEDALASYDQAVSKAPDNAAAWYNRGLLLSQLERRDEALLSHERALAIRPGHVKALKNRGNILHEMERHAEALACFDQALARTPADVPLLRSRAALLLKLGRPDAALADCALILTTHPEDIEALYHHGLSLLDQRRCCEALASFEAALSIDPGFAPARNNHALALWGMGDNAKALASFEQGLVGDPQNVELLFNRGSVLVGLKRFAQAAESFEAVLALQPEHRFAFGSLVDAALHLCDWERTARLGAQIAAHPQRVVPPLTLLGYSDDPARLLANARLAMREKAPVSQPPLWEGVSYHHDKIRIAYLSTDFREHATAWLAAELFESHDRQFFSTTAISYSPDDGSPMRARLVKAFDHFVDVSGQSDMEVARLLREMEIDIAIDLNGHAAGRPAVLSCRPAPVQVNYLGFPGSMGAPFIDYVIADPVVLPFTQQPFYDERIVHLPDSYQPNDTKRVIAAATPDRAEMGLPATGFVFCSFNNSWKITATHFDIWMNLLAQVPGSVLWLLHDNDGATEHLKAEAQNRGIDPARLVFAPRLDLPAHLARHRLADLFLDTLPCNAHTTASDALWAGLPVLTCAGQSFAGRVAASLVEAAGLSELVTGNLDAYAALALTLAREPARLQSLRSRLEAARASPLFDVARLCRHIEAAYASMWQNAEAGRPPRSFAVEPA